MVGVGWGNVFIIQFSRNKLKIKCLLRQKVGRGVSPPSSMLCAWSAISSKYLFSIFITIIADHFSSFQSTVIAIMKIFLRWIAFPLLWKLSIASFLPDWHYALDTSPINPPGSCSNYSVFSKFYSVNLHQHGSFFFS